MSAVWFASDWARRGAEAEYPLSDRAHVVGFGANIADPEVGPRTTPKSEPRLLLVGVKWHRKGVDKAIQAVDALRSAGVAATLDVVGVNPPDSSWSRPYVNYHGYLSKSREADLERLTNLFATADLFILPTRDEPFGIVLDEAAAYALPVVASNVGGVSDHVDAGGLLLPSDATPADYASAVRRVLDRPLYAEMSTAGRRDFERRLSWDARVKQALPLIAAMGSSVD